MCVVRIIRNTLVCAVCSSKDRVTSSARLSTSQGQWDTRQSDRVAEGRPTNTVTSCYVIGSQSSVRDKNRQVSIAYCDGTTVQVLLMSADAEV
jgi:hypothetical protein